MNRIGVAGFVWRVFGLALVVSLAGVGCQPASGNETWVELAPLPAKALLTVPPDREGVKVFDPITPYIIAKHAPGVEYAAYPVHYAADWTQYGVGYLHSNGRVYSTVGDHRGTNADSCLYEFDPSTRRLRWLASLRKAVKDFKGGDYGFGKMHSRICQGGDNKLYFASWWGADSDSPKYKGDRIFCFDPSSGKLTDLGITVPGYGAPTIALDPTRMILYGEFEHPTARLTDFAAYDLKGGSVLFRGGHANDSSAGRGIMIDRAGCAYYACAGTVRRYDPSTNSVSDLPDRLPHGKKFREPASRSRSDGTIYVATRAEHSSLVLLDGQAGKVTPIATLWGDAKALDMDATGRWVYYVGDDQITAEGDEEIPQEFKGKKNPVAGLPVVQVDLANGARQKVIAFLEIPLGRAIGWEKRGKYACYSIMVSPDGRTLYITLNGFRPCDLGFYHATPLFVVLHIPAQEMAGSKPARAPTPIRPTE